MSIPSMPIQVTDKLVGGDWKFYDYYYGINVTDFAGRHVVIGNTNNNDKETTQQEPNLRTEQEWLDLVHAFPQPSFPFPLERLRTFELFQSIFE